MKKIKRYITIILFVMLLISIIPLTASAAETSGRCGKNVTWSYEEATKTLTISGTGAMYDCEYYSGYNYAYTPWSSYVVDTVIVENGVTRIGAYAFYRESIKKIVIGDSVSEIGYRSLVCEQLESITIDEANPYYLIENGVLYSKDKKTLVKYPSKLVEKNFSIPDEVTTIQEMAFCYSAFLENIEIPDGVKTIEPGTFTRCDRLTTVTIGDGTETIGQQAFSHCKNLTTIIIGDSIEMIGVDAFLCCASLQSVEVPDSVKTIEYRAFYDCDNLRTVTIGDGTESIGDYAFYDCDNLRTVTIGDGTKSIGEYAFYGCGNLNTIILGDAVETIGKNAFHLSHVYMNIYLRDNIKTFIPNSFRTSSTVKIYYSGTEEQWESIYKTPFLGTPAEVYCNYHVHKPDCETVEPTCTTHGYEKQFCRYHTDSTCDYIAVTTYTSNPTGHTFNEEGICETCGEKEVSTNHVNTQMLSIESVLAMVMNLLSKIFGMFAVA